MKQLTMKASSQRRVFRLLSFAIPFFAILISFASYGFFPFGDKSVLFGDASIEYYPFLLLMRRILANGESLLYTWRAGLGSNVISDVFGSFCTSIFNMVGMLLPESLFSYWLCISVMLRIGLAGYFMALLLQAISPKETAAVPAFAVTYALNMWVLTSYWQITMMDVYMMTPLVLLGLLKLVRDEDMRLYPLMLGCSLLSNAYNSIFTAIITGFFWIGLLIVLKKPWRSIPKEIARFLGYSFLSAGFACCIMIPSLVSIGATDSFAEGFHWTEFYESFMMNLGQFATGVFPRINANPANIASSMLLCVTLLGYLTTRRIPLRERIYVGFVAVFTFMSLWYSPLNFIWHGFHYPFVTVNRFAYLMPMILAFMGWRYTVTRKQEDTPEDAEQKWYKRKSTYGMLLQVLLMAGFSGFVIFCSAHAETNDIPLISAFFVLVFLVLYLFRHFQPKKPMPFYVCLTIMVALELALDCRVAIGYSKSNISGMTEREERVAKMSAALDDVKADAADAMFYRTGVYGNAKINEELEVDITGGTGTFNSFIPINLNLLLEQLGMQNQPETNKFYKLRAIPPFSTLMLDFQYILSTKEGAEELVLYDAIQEPDDDEALLPMKFRYDLPLGFCINENIPLPEILDLGKDQVQNYIAEHFSGLDIPLSTPYEEPWVFVPDECKDATTEMVDANTIHTVTDFEPDDATHDTALHAQFAIETTIQEDGFYWLQVTHNDNTYTIIKRSSCCVNDEYIYNDSIISAALEQYKLVPLKLKAGDVVKLNYYLLPNSEVEVGYQLIQFHEAAFDTIYQKLMEGKLQLTSFEDTRVTGDVTTESDSLLYLAIPYRPGWTAYVDGQKTDIVPVLDAMVGVPVTKGKHTVTISFFPPGLIPGIIISCCSVLLYAILVIRYQRSRKQTKTEKQSCEPSN